MSRVLFALCLAVFLTGGVLAILKGISLQNPQAQKLAKAEPDMQFRKLASGAVIYEEVPVSGTIEEIEPAAGEDVAKREPRYHYDPLTQTYRIETVDRNGNKSQDILSNPRNP